MRFDGRCAGSSVERRGVAAADRASPPSAIAARVGVRHRRSRRRPPASAAQASRARAVGAIDARDLVRRNRVLVHRRARRTTTKVA